MKSVALSLIVVASALWLSPRVKAASFHGADDFNDSAADPSLWGPDLVLGGGTITEQNGRLEFSSTGTGIQEARRIWARGAAPATSNWSVQLDIAVQLTLSAPNQYASFGIDISNGANSQDLVYVELFQSTFTGILEGRGFLSEIRDNGATAGSADSGDLAASQGAVRFTFDSAGQIFRSYYDANGGAGGYHWSELSSFGVGHSGGGATANVDWEMQSGDSFVIDLYGYSDSFAVISGTVHGDNFAAIPEWSLTTPFTAVLLLIAARWARRGGMRGYL